MAHVSKNTLTAPGKYSSNIEKYLDGCKEKFNQILSGVRDVRGSGRSLVYKLTERLNYGVEPLRCGRRLIRFVKKQTNAAKRPVGVRMAACKEGSAD